jgi:hypothetical protein
VALYNINLQAIPMFPYSSGVVLQPELYYSIAFSEPGCITTAFPLQCSTNDYEFALYVCGRDACPFNPLDKKASHNEFLTNEVCKPQTGVKLDYCNDGVLTAFSRYFCCITGGGLPIVSDAFIEWFYCIKISEVAESYVTGKFTFMANKDYILNMHNAHGYLGPQGNGIPLFNPSNHNPQ